MTAVTARARPVDLVESGPAAGVSAAVRVAAALGLRDAISFDMGGTTAKVGLILDGEARTLSEFEVGAAQGSGTAVAIASGYPILGSIVDLIEVGAGGGSIAWIDSGGHPRVGPQSAGADPGPASYGRGGQAATVTDANVVLGRIVPENFAEGVVRLDVDAAFRSLEPMAAALGIDVEAAAGGVVGVAESLMAEAVRLLSVERGHDPREFTLIAFGGAGPLHACRLAAELGIPIGRHPAESERPVGARDAAQRLPARAPPDPPGAAPARVGRSHRRHPRPARHRGDGQPPARPDPPARSPAPATRRGALCRPVVDPVGRPACAPPGPDRRRGSCVIRPAPPEGLRLRARARADRAGQLRGGRRRPQPGPGAARIRAGRAAAPRSATGRDAARDPPPSPGVAPGRGAGRRTGGHRRARVDDRHRAGLRRDGPRRRDAGADAAGARPDRARGRGRGSAHDTSRAPGAGPSRPRPRADGRPVAALPPDTALGQGAQRPRHAAAADPGLRLPPRRPATQDRWPARRVGLAAGRLVRAVRPDRHRAARWPGGQDRAAVGRRPLVRGLARRRSGRSRQRLDPP